MAKRAYNKKSEYWGKFTSEASVKVKDNTPIPQLPKSEDFIPEGFGDPFVSFASDRSGKRESSKLGNGIVSGRYAKDYAEIAALSLPYCSENGGQSARESIWLCQLAYANVAIFKNSIDLMSEFSNSEIYFEGGSKAANMFFKQWFKATRIDKICRQYFLEYYRSSNVFIYRFNGKLPVKSAKKLTKFFSDREKLDITIPTRYVMLNPVDVVAANTTSFSGKASTFIKVLSQYELGALKNPKSQADQDLFDSLTPETKEKIKKGTFQKDGITIPLEPDRLITSFAKKQDYEPFAVPFGFPVLKDINAKMELKKFDQAVSRCVENVILLVTMGAKPEDGGINQNNLAAMRELFKNESFGRVLISDYTTTAEFVIPDISKVVGPEKYQILNEDIKEGLQNIITGSEKYAATQIKAQLFMERLNEARDAFLNDFLIPEMEEIARSIGLKDIPTVKFSEKSLKDEVQFARAITRLVELGVVHPDEGIKALNTGYISDNEDIRGQFKAQWKKDRDAGFYEPLIGGGNKDELGKEKGRPTGTSKKAKSSVSVASTKDIFAKASDLSRKVSEKYKTLGGNAENNKELLESICEGVICSRSPNDWESYAVQCMENPDLMLTLNPLSEVLDIAAEMNLSTYSAAIYHHASNL